MSKYTWLLFVAGAAITWGCYVTTIDHGRKEFNVPNGKPNPNAAMRAFLFIGIAYFLAAVIVPGFFLAAHKLPASVDPGMNLKGATLSTIAGLLGAAGALCIVFAVTYARRGAHASAALYVAPLVFSFAPIVNCLVSMAWDPPANKPAWQFYVGLLLAIAGAALVMIYKPAEAPHLPAASLPPLSPPATH